MIECYIAINPQQSYPETSNKREWPEDFKNNLDSLTTLAFIAAKYIKNKIRNLYY